MCRFLLVILALLFTGCVRPPIQGRQDPYKSSQIMFATNKLRVDTAVDAPIVTRDAAGLLHVEVPIRSAIDVQLYIDYRVTFFDKNGQSVGTLGWFTKTFPPNTPDRIVVNSPDSRATDFQVDFRYAQ